MSRFALPRVGRERRPPAESPPPAATESLPLLKDLLDRAAGGGRCVAVDFAPASSAGIAVFNALQCRLDIVDFPAALKSLAASRDADEFRARLPGLYRAHPQHPPNLILCWDFLNYLPRQAIAALLEYLVASARQDVKLHALIAYTDPEMPAWPCRYHCAERGAITVPADTQRRPSPRYTPKDLLRSLPGFQIERAMLLRNGYQEYILSLKPTEAVSAEEKPSTAETKTVASLPATASHQ